MHVAVAQTLLGAWGCEQCPIIWPAVLGVFLKELDDLVFSVHGCHPWLPLDRQSGQSLAEQHLHPAEL